MGLRFSAFFLIVFVSLGGLELAVEYRAHLRGHDTLLFPRVARSEPPPKPGSARFGPTEAFPFRSAIVPEERPPRTVRYWIASSSHAQDTGQRPERIFPNVLEQRLRADGQSAQVLNAARAGMGIEGNLEQLARLAPRWRPDVVILYQGSLEINRLSQRHLAGGTASADGVPTEGPAPNAVVRLLESTTLYALLKTNVTTRISAARPLARRLPAEAFADFEAMLREFVRGVRQQGAAPVLCTFAAMHDRDDLPDFSDDAVTSIFRYNPHLSLEGWIDAIERINALVRRVGAEQDVLVVEIGEALGGRSELFVDFVHFTAAGHAAVAEIIAAALSESSRG
jgi:lysophospholipase L1-like esterase